jgi:XTP/dITP diphosphohydrolase
MQNNERLVIASNNAHKVREIKAILAGCFSDICSMSEAGLNMEVEETGKTFEQNAIIKAEAVAKAGDCWALADDSGLCVDTLGGAPGVHSSRWSGGGDEANNDKLLHELEGKENRFAHYMCVMALANPGGVALTAEGRCEGSIGFERKGAGGFGYDPLFVVPGKGCTMAEMSDEEKNAISHRGNALKTLVRKIREKGML